MHWLEPGLRYSNTPVRAQSVTGKEPCGGPAVTIINTVSLIQQVNHLLSSAGGSGSCPRGATHTLAGIENFC
jgi:hypothetical protein